MATVKFPPTSGFYELDCYVAQLLGQAGIPAFIWGEKVLHVYLQKRYEGFFRGWVVPDEAIAKAVQVLDDEGFPPCKDGNECAVFAPDQKFPVPDHHYHDYYHSTKSRRSWEGGVILYQKSRLFSEFPEPPVGCPRPGDPYYTFLASGRQFQKASDEPQNGQPENQYPVKLPVPARYLEAMCLLKIRDIEGYATISSWNSAKTGFVDYMRDEEHIMYYVKDLKRWHDKKDKESMREDPGFQSTWDRLKTRRDKELDAALRKIENRTHTLKPDDLKEPWLEWMKLCVDRKYAQSQNDPDGNTCELRIYWDMRESGTLPKPDPKPREILMRTLPVEKRLRVARLIDDPVD
ncbi:hypothetical protein BO94DRAFT_153626 [Aspergillus sclerotioniger CBS 115572]|uniref:Uncharacterized protein n=1 Tax=Aspergillus sclerotioniger CBS 115572 TaxID=1450535 RepID=A0A317W4M3_9EURO|nr:hypothetical protein BO94DRAFT_153626 [Aspergillus sclerotioniger CBS 115572]PWY80959.1 hypothetical protein BO94DRAFT_153626 [Aspergillus sclerotioniger CBS 115572]